jgi:hypothetical protein
MITDQKQNRQSVLPWISGEQWMQNEFQSKFDNPILSLRLLNLRERVFLNTAVIL